MVALSIDLESPPELIPVLPRFSERLASATLGRVVGVGGVR